MPSIYRLLAFAILLVSASAAAAGPTFEIKTICRTAIAAIMDRDPKLVQATDAPGGVVVLTYTRPFDNFVFTYRCRVDGDHVVWADEPGRWRDGAKDARISFEVEGAAERLRIIVSRANGTSAQQLFDRELNEIH
jgi:hypothetical protein